ncbi:MAG TPA: hypothetical protein VI756_15475 [Blastocatellia bacterium]
MNLRERALESYTTALREQDKREAQNRAQRIEDGKKNFAHKLSRIFELSIADIPEPTTIDDGLPPYDFNFEVQIDGVRFRNSCHHDQVHMFGAPCDQCKKPRSALVDSLFQLGSQLAAFEPTTHTCKQLQPQPEPAPEPPDAIPEYGPPFQNDSLKDFVSGVAIANELARIANSLDVTAGALDFFRQRREQIDSVNF